MSNMKKNMEENNPLLQVYMKILPATAIAIAAIYFLVKLISGMIAPDQLILTAKYNDYEEGAVIQTPMRVAKDAAFEEEVKQQKEKGRSFTDLLIFFEATAEKSEELAALDAQQGLTVPVEEENEDGTYTFKFESAKLSDKVYVKAPMWWQPVETDGTWTMPFAIGEKMELSADLEGFVNDDAAFEITNIETSKVTTGIFNITVNMTAAGDVVPSKVKLIMGDEVFAEWDGSSELVYNEGTGFEDRTLVFRYNRSLREDISDLVAEATVEVQEYTLCRVFEDAEITSNMDGLELVFVEE